MTYELRVTLPYLSPLNPHIDKMKQELIEQVEQTGMIPSYVGVSNVRLVEVTDA